EPVEPAVQLLERGLLYLRELALEHDDEVDIAVFVGIAQREGALQVDTDEALAEHAADTGDEIGQHRVQLWESCPHRVERRLAPVTEGRIPYAGGETWYQVVGDGEQPGKLPLLCLHGGPGALHDYLE